MTEAVSVLRFSWKFLNLFSSRQQSRYNPCFKAVHVLSFIERYADVSWKGNAGICGRSVCILKRNIIPGKKSEGYLLNWFIKCRNFFFPVRLLAKLLMLLFRCFTSNEIKSWETLSIEIITLLANMMSGYSWGLCHCNHELKTNPETSPTHL